MTAIDAGARTVTGLDAPAFPPILTPRATATKPLTTLVPRTEPAIERRRLWEHRYARRLQATDAVVVISATALTALIDTSVWSTGAFAVGRVAVLTTVVWLLCLALVQSRAASISGSGATEYKRVIHATGFAFGVIAMIFVLFQWQGVRLQLIAALPAGLFALLVGRWLWRKWLLGQRRYGHYASRAIVTGSRDDIEYVLRTLDERGSGYVTIGAAPSDQSDEPIVIDGRVHDVVGTMSSVAMHARTLEADTIIVATRPEDDPDFIKRLSWELEGTASELIISSRVADVAGPRISLRPVDGLPLIHVKIPEFEGGKHALKRAVDVAFSSLVMIPFSLIVMPVIALLIKLDDGGPVFFRQTRIGRDGQEFGILKFRTMRADAEERLAELEAQSDGNGVLFKMKNDPRITRIGAILRKYSIDELPQFWNVLIGDMSVVGPRPPLPKEVREYEGKVYRRLFIKPGITGLWQVSGRSDLSWEESVRLDLRYVENWSITSDLMIMWRTAKVMIAPTGAY
ncbi:MULTISPECIES: sugar transferase [Microbacterium]|uniref:Putative sugar transferase EpsL n=1 Tax=Microbacterium trichothecenolyticum TaxID=69370 RepID=A0A0M2HHL5_MICTR|nr:MULTISPECIES: sugar transferase [Microbacterium]KJL43795.1 putative sugar transferase EpsL [Microbacterium trichothecenolyticum]MDR7191219.1 exopolysaccharide biosynthesis polyprenyl glycosylphosphotransferase [Microbacterium sp. BE35]